jgi:hypothetical protein
MLLSAPEGVHTREMQRLTRAPKVIGSGWARGTLVYVALNVLIIVAEARWHFLYRLLLWDVSELRLFGFLMSKSLHH